MPRHQILGLRRSTPVYYGNGVTLVQSIESAVKSGLDLAEASLSGADLKYANLKGAKLRRADLRKACLYGADLTGAALEGADIAGTCIIDGGHDNRGHRFWAWLHPERGRVYSAGCKVFYSVAEGFDYFDNYSGLGDPFEGVSRLGMLGRLASKRWP